MQIVLERLKYYQQEFDLLLTNQVVIDTERIIGKLS